MGTKHTDFIIINGINTLNLGISVEELPSFTPAQHMYETNTLPGRDGYVLEDQERCEGNIYPATLCLHNDNPYALDEIAELFRGEVTVCFSNMPDRFFKGFISNKISVEEFIRNEVYTFPVYFNCQPYGYDYKGAEENRIDADKVYTVSNPCNCTAKPTFTILPNGSKDIEIYINDKVALTINNKSHTFIVDCENKLCYLEDQSAFIRTKGKFIEIPPYSTFTFKVTNCATGTVKWNWRWY